jgi:hypothetical protein
VGGAFFVVKKNEIFRQLSTQENESFQTTFTQESFKTQFRSNQKLKKNGASR